MADRVIDNPIINSPCRAPARHFTFDNDGITGEIAEGRRPGAYFIPVPKAGKRALQAEPSLTADQIDPNHFVKSVRAKVDRWAIRMSPRPPATCWS